MEMYGKILIEHRENAGITQEQLAKETGITQAAISYWEADKRTPSITSCIILADYYGISVDDLIGHTPKKNW